MQLLLVTFSLRGVSDEEYRRGCEAEAHAFADVPGLVWKTWIADASTGTYGGVYTFADGRALDAYLGSDLFAAIAQDPTVADLRTSTFDVLEQPSRVTHALGRLAA